MAGWRGVMLLVSHDRELLEQVDRTADLRDGEVRWYGGNFSAYQAALAVEQEAAGRMVRVAEADLRRQQRELVDTQIVLNHRKRYGQKMFDNKREPGIVMGQRKRQAQVSAGKLRNQQQEKLDEARERLAAAEAAVREDAAIRVDLAAGAGPGRAHRAHPHRGQDRSASPRACGSTWNCAAPNGSR